MEMYQDIPRLCTALAEWLGCLLFIFILKKRWNRWITAGICLSALCIQMIFLTATENFPLYLWLAVMFTAILMMYGFLRLAVEISLDKAMYCCASAFISAEFTASLEWQLHFYLVRNIGQGIWEFCFLIGMYGIVFFAIYRIYMRLNVKDYLLQLTWKGSAVAVGIAGFSFLFSNLSYVSTNSPFSGKVPSDIFLIRTLVDLCGIMVLCIYQSSINERIAERERDTIESMYQKQYDQYRYYQESMEMIHIKYHDLKHQIAGLRAENDPDKRNAWLNSLEEGLDERRLVHETGNKVFDTIYAAKLFQAQKYKIRMTCVADGKLLDFLHVTDICTIFGNALDNAVESVVTIEDPEKRLIHILITEQRCFVLIQISNFIEYKIDLEPGELPETSKQDKARHGYGLKSIRYSVKKYQGTMSIQTEDNWFELRIMIPLAPPFKTK